MAICCGANPTQLSFILHLFMLLLRSSLGEDTVAEDLGKHQLQRLVDLLTVHECEELLLVLSRPEENIFKQLDRLSAERNQLGLQSRTRRSIDKESHCHPALTDWLQAHGTETYYDRLSRALQQIGRTDVAIEVSKNINQDKILVLQRYVDAYSKHIDETASRPAQSQTEEQQRTESLRRSERKVRDLSWKDLDLVVERHPVPPYERRMLDGAWPLFYGLLLGFVGAFFVGVIILLITVRVSLRERQDLCRRSSQAQDKARSHPRPRRHASSPLAPGTAAEKTPLQQRESQSEAPGLTLLF